MGQFRLGLRELRQERWNFSPSERNYSHLVGRDSEPKRSRNWQWNGPSQSVGPTASPRSRGVDSRPAALVQETDGNGNGTVRGVCSGRAGRRDGRVGTEQSKFPETSTGSDRRRCLHDSDGSKTLNTIFADFGILEEKDDPPNPVSNVGTRWGMVSARGRNN